MGPSVSVYVQRYEQYGLKDWLHKLYSTSFAHGSVLAEALGTPVEGRPGLADNCYISDRILQDLTDEGWILRAEKPFPSREQLFFGWGGRAQGKKPNVTTAGTSEFGYSPNYECVEFMKYLGVK